MSPWCQRDHVTELTIMPVPSQPLKIAIAGGGIAAVELALALNDLAGERVKLTMIAPNAEFRLRALSTAAPFSVDQVRHHSLSELAARVGAELISDEVTAVDPQRHAVRLATGGSVSYDALVLAVGSRRRTAFIRAMTFSGDTSTLPFNGLLADLEEGWSHSVAFVVPPGTTWPLPLYELALMTARSVRGMGIDDVRLQIVSPEATPLALFGTQASAAVADLLERAGIDFHGGAHARAGENGRLELLPGGETLDAERIVALPTIEGPQLAGVPTDEHGFIPIDEDGRVRGVSDVYAAGDGTTYPVKQGGIACQLADAIAERLAAAAGADVDPQPFAPVLRGRLLTGHGAQYLEHPLDGEPGSGSSPELRLWSAAHKVEGRYLSPWLAELDGTAPEAVPEPVAADEGHVDIEVQLPASYDRRDALQLDPYSPLR
jgi:sulfide:quinone oxidoreductase